MPKTNLIKILLVEDDPLSAFIIKKILVTNLVVNVVVAENGKKAIKEWERDQFNMILMDLELPDIDGFNVTETIRDLENSSQVEATPIIALTAHVSKSVQELCFIKGMNAFIEKPVNIESLLKLLQKHIRRDSHSRS